MTNEDKKQPGDKRIDADTWNTIIDMLKDWKRNKFEQKKGDFFAKVTPRLTILVGNVTATTYSTAFKVLRLINTPLVVTTENKLQLNMRPIMQVGIPESSTDAICITQSPAPSEDEDPDQFAYVLAAVLGITLAYVRINDESDLFAVPIAGNVDFLNSASAGQVRIIEVLDEMQEESGVSGFMPVSGLDESGSGVFDSVKLCIVNIIGGGAGGGGGESGGSGQGTITGGCELSALKPTDCVKFNNSYDGSIHNGINTGAGVWTSETSLAYPGGSGVAVLTKVTGGWTLTVNAIAMDTCGTGCWMGGPATGHASSSGGGKCNGETFTVCVECRCCEVEGWDGEGWYCIENVDEECIVAELLEEDRYDCSLVICSGPYETEEEAQEACGPVSTSCCPDDTWARNLQLTFASDGTGHLASFNGLSYAIGWTGITFQWQGDVSPPVVWGLDSVDKLRFACGGEPPLFIADGIQSGVPIVRMIAMESGATGSLTKTCATNTVSGVMAGVSPITGTISFTLVPV